MYGTAVGAFAAVLMDDSQYSQVGTVKMAFGCCGRVVKLDLDFQWRKSLALLSRSLSVSPFGKYSLVGRQP